MKKLIAMAATLCLLITITACGQTEGSQTETTLPQTEAAETTTVAAETTAEAEETTTPAAENKDKLVFQTKTLQGEDVDSSVFSAYELTMVNIWGTYCGPCIKEMPDLEQLYAELAPKNVNLVGIICDSYLESTEKYYADVAKLAEKIITENNVTYANYLQNDELYVFMQNRVRVVPTTFFVDADGVIVGNAIEGALSKEKYMAEIDARLQLLKK